jgi:hypothetical protein
LKLSIQKGLAMLKLLLPLIVPATILAACSGGDQNTSNPQNNIVAQSTDSPSNTEMAATTGDPMLDGVIEWIEADDRPKQTLYRTFTLVRSTTGFSDGVKQPSAEPDDPGIAKYEMEAFTQQIPDEIKQRMAEAGAARILFLEPCGARTDEALGVPESYLNAEADYEMLKSARLISATRATGIRDFKIPKPEAINPSGEEWSDSDNNRVILALNDALWAAQPKAQGDIPLVILDYSDGCGAGEIMVAFKTDPVVSQLRLIPEFFFTICAKQKRDAWSNTDCRWWKDVLAEGGEMVAGTYRYHAQTPDGKIRQGRFSITEKRLQNSDGSPVEVLNIKI